MLQKAETAEPGDTITPEEAIKDPFVHEFLDLEDEYSEPDLEEALIQHFTNFLLESGDDFAFVGRQRRIRVDDSWFRIDLVFFHRRLRCLFLADLLCGRPHNSSSVAHRVMWRSTSQAAIVAWPAYLNAT